MVSRWCLAVLVLLVVFVSPCLAQAPGVEIGARTDAGSKSTNYLIKWHTSGSQENFTATVECHYGGAVWGTWNYTDQSDWYTNHYRGNTDGDIQLGPVPMPTSGQYEVDIIFYEWYGGVTGRGPFHFTKTVTVDWNHPTDLCPDTNGDGICDDGSGGAHGGTNGTPTLPVGSGAGATGGPPDGASSWGAWVTSLFTPSAGTSDGFKTLHEHLRTVGPWGQAAEMSAAVTAHDAGNPLGVQPLLPSEMGLSLIGPDRGGGLGAQTFPVDHLPFPGKDTVIGGGGNSDASILLIPGLHPHSLYEWRDLFKSLMGGAIAFMFVIALVLWMKGRIQI